MREKKGASLTHHVNIVEWDPEHYHKKDAGKYYHSIIKYPIVFFINGPRQQASSKQPSRAMAIGGEGQEKIIP
jgi:hypothetical protein